MIKAYKEGIPDNGEPFPEGSKIVKIEWIKRKNPASPYFVEVPGHVKDALVYREGLEEISEYPRMGICSVCV